jgi:hypothetical protein
MLSQGIRAMSSALLIVWTAGCGGSDDRPLPAVLTLDGMAGVAVFAKPAAVREAWESPLALVETTEGSVEVDVAPVCAGSQRGMLIFVGGGLAEMRFFSGTVTDRGVGNGSSRAELRETYGDRLEQAETWDAGRTVATLRITSTGSPPRASIDFDLDSSDRVWQVRYGLRQRQPRGPEVDGVAC